MAEFDVNDSREIRWIDFIRPITFRWAVDAGATFISRSWISKYIKKDELLVKRNLNKLIVIAKGMRVSAGLKSFLRGQRPIELKRWLDQERLYIKWRLNLKKKREGSYSAVYRELKKSGIKPFHVISGPQHHWTRMVLLKTWLELLNVAESGEFFLYTAKNSNPKNDHLSCKFGWYQLWCMPAASWEISSMFESVYVSRPNVNVNHQWKRTIIEWRILQRHRWSVSFLQRSRSPNLLKKWQFCMIRPHISSPFRRKSYFETVVSISCRRIIS